MSQGSSESPAGKFMTSCRRAPRCWKASWAGKGNREGRVDPRPAVPVGAQSRNSQTDRDQAYGS